MVMNFGHLLNELETLIIASYNVAIKKKLVKIIL